MLGGFPHKHKQARLIHSLSQKRINFFKAVTEMVRPSDWLSICMTDWLSYSCTQSKELAVKGSAGTSNTRSTEVTDNSPPARRRRSTEVTDDSPPPRRRRRVENEEESESESEYEFIGVGDDVSCNWYQDGDVKQWYDCVVLAVDAESRTAHVKAKVDGEEGENMSWDYIIKL